MVAVCRIGKEMTLLNCRANWIKQEGRKRKQRHRLAAAVPKGGRLWTQMTVGPFLKAPIFSLPLIFLLLRGYFLWKKISTRSKIWPIKLSLIHHHCGIVFTFVQLIYHALVCCREDSPGMTINTSWNAVRTPMVSWPHRSPPVFLLDLSIPTLSFFQSHAGG